MHTVLSALLLDLKYC